MHPADLSAFIITLAAETGAMAMIAWFGRHPVFGPAQSPGRFAFAAGASALTLALNAISHPFFVFWFPLLQDALSLEFPATVIAAEALVVIGEGIIYFTAIYFLPGRRLSIAFRVGIAFLISLFLNALSYFAGVLIFTAAT